MESAVHAFTNAVVFSIVVGLVYIQGVRKRLFPNWEALSPVMRADRRMRLRLTRVQQWQSIIAQVRQEARESQLFRLGVVAYVLVVLMIALYPLDTPWVWVNLPVNAIVYLEEWITLLAVLLWVSLLAWEARNKERGRANETLVERLARLTRDMQRVATEMEAVQALIQERANYVAGLVEEAENAELRKNAHRLRSDDMMFVFDREFRRSERRTFRTTFLLSVAFLVLGSVVTIYVQNWMDHLGWLR